MPRILSLFVLTLCLCVIVDKSQGNLSNRLIQQYRSRRNDERVSWKECNLSDGLRLDCGFYGVNDDACYQRGCCWGESQEEGVPWCYHSIPTIKSACLMNTNERIDCGWYGIRKEQCLGTGCCWQPTNDNGAAWCYQTKRVPVYVGECGVPAISPVTLSRIVGGEEATAHSWPWMVSLQGDGDHFCGGSLINNQWVMTAAHCEPGFTMASRQEVVIGLHSQSSQEGSQRIRIVDILPHERYGQNGGYDNDVMLLKLEHPVEFSESISPVCLAEPDLEVNAGRRCYTTGWGHTSFGGSAPDKLQQVMVPIIDNDQCNTEEWYNGKIDETMVCAGYEEGGRDSCQGDSGGPLVCYEEDKWVLVGVVSWGEGCASTRKPGIYSKVAHNAKWAEAKISELS